MLSSPRNATLFLRLLAILQLLTGAIAIIPLSWIAWWHHWLGLGALPNDATLRYVIRGGAFVQGAIGILLWIMAGDVIRYALLFVRLFYWDSCWWSCRGRSRSFSRLYLTY